MGIAVAMAALSLQPGTAAVDHGKARESSLVGYRTSAASLPARSAARLAASVGGSWSVLTARLPVRAIHSITGPTGEVLLIEGSGNDPKTFAAGQFKSSLWNPLSGAVTAVSTPVDMFCAGHVLLPDGTALVFGGTSMYKTASTPFHGLKSAYVFDFFARAYRPVGDMAVGRWYPTGTTDGQGNVLVTSGYDENGQPTSVTERFDFASGTWSTLTSAPRQFPNYPSIFLSATGELFYAGTYTPGQVKATPVGFWDPRSNGFRVVRGLSGNRGAAAAGWVGPVQNQRMIVLGGNTAATGVVDLAAASPEFRAGPALSVTKHYVGYVNLPDFTSVESNGGTGNRMVTAVHDTALLNEAGTAWTPMNPSPVGRLYHSQLFLLSDGRVMSISSDPDDGEFNQQIAVFSPPYLFKGTRPVITSAPSILSYGASYGVQATVTGAGIARASLITLPVTTHSTAVNQRVIDLYYAGGRISVPSSGNIAPPGFYLLFVVDSLGRPSVARIVRLS